MAKDEGFAVMDVSTDIVNDPKFKRIHRQAPELVTPAFMAYVGIVGESWKAGRRIAIVDAWPALLLPIDSAVVTVMTDVGLLDRRGHIPLKTWDGWFKEVNERRVRSRERWRRANEKRAAESAAATDPSTKATVATAATPRGRRAATGAIRSVPLRSSPIRSVSLTRDSAPPPRATNGEVDPYDEVVAWLAGRKAWVDSPKIETALARMVDRKGAAAVIAAMAAVPDAEMAAQFVYGAQHALFPLASSRTTPKSDEPDQEYVDQQLAERRRARKEARSGNA